MNRSVFRYATCFVLLLSGMATANPVNEERVEKLEPVYKKILWQEADFAFIASHYPDLKKELEETRKVVDGSIVGEGAKGLPDVLAKLKGDEWKAYSEAEIKASRSVAEEDPMGPQDAVEYLRKVRRDHEQPLAHPDARKLLSTVPRFVKNPGLEYEEGYVVPFVTKLGGESYKGLDIVFQVPASWNLSPSPVEGMMIFGFPTGPGAEPMNVMMSVAEYPLVDGRPMTFEQGVAHSMKGFDDGLKDSPQMKLIGKSEVELGGRKFLQVVLDQKMADTSLVTDAKIRQVMFGTMIQGKWVDAHFVFMSYDGAPMTHIELQEYYKPVYTKLLESIKESK